LGEGNSGAARAAEASSGPSAMAQTSLGTIFLYEASDDDILACSRAATAMAGIRGLLERVGSKSGPDASAVPPRLTSGEVASLTAPEIESLLEIYLGSPKNQWYQMKSLEANSPIVRGGGESASAYFDRLIRWYAGYRRAGAGETLDVPPVRAEPAAAVASPAAPGGAAADMLAGFAARMQASQESVQTSLRWAAGSLVLLMAVLSGGAAWLGYQSQERDRKTEAWQQQMKMFAENNAALERGFTDLAAENARLKARIATLEARPAGAAIRARAAAEPRNAPARTPAKPARPPARK
jgi:hypothetical protein